MKRIDLAYNLSSFRKRIEIQSMKQQQQQQQQNNNVKIQKDEVKKKIYAVTRKRGFIMQIQ